MILNKMFRIVLIAVFVSLFTATGVFAMENIPTPAENKANASKGFELGKEAVELLRADKRMEAYKMSKKSYTALKEIASEKMAPIIQRVLTNIKYGGIYAKNSLKAANKGDTAKEKELMDKAWKEFGIGLTALENVVNALAAGES